MAEGCIVKVCDCNVSMSNTGTDCQSPFEAARKIILVPTFDSTGARNGLSLASPINLATFTALINQADSSKRWYPIPSLSDVNDTRNDPITQTTAENRTLFVAEGLRSFKATIWGKDGNPTLAGKINAARCNDMSAYIITRTGSLIGKLSSDGTILYPLTLDSESIYAKFMPPTPKTKQAVEIIFNFHPDETDTCMKQIIPTEMDGADLLMLRGLTDVHATIDDISTTGFSIELTTDYGTAINPTRVKGMVITNFISTVAAATSKIRNSTDAADVTITTVTERTGDDAGIYDVVIPAQTVADHLIPLLKADGFDFTDVVNAEFVIV